MVFFIFVSITLIIYFAFVGFALVGWKGKSTLYKEKDGLRNTQSVNAADGVSIIIPFRNEAHVLNDFLSQTAFRPQTDCLFEIILVNDHSSDNWMDLISDLPIQYRLLNNDGDGKKSAILTGVKASKYQTILTTDVDCTIPINWVKKMLNAKRNANASMVFGGVRLLHNGSLFGQFQSIDYSAMATVGAGFAHMNYPFICSGANLMFDKDDYFSVIGKIRMDYLSGDDVFLLHAFVERKFIVSFVHDTEAIVTSKVQSSFRSLINQRVRWGSKAIAYTNSTAVLVSIIVFVTNATLVLAFGLLSNNIVSLVVFSSIYLLKAVVDILFFRATDRFWQLGCSYMSLIITSLIYPMWILITALLGFTWRGSWKGRK